MYAFRRFSDHIDHDLRLRQHHHVATRGFGRRGAHEFGEEALTVRLYAAIVLGDDVPARLRLPSGSTDFRFEKVRFRDASAMILGLSALLG